MSEVSNGGSKLPILPVMMLLLAAVVAGLSGWINKCDERLFQLTRDVPTRAEIQTLRSDLTARLDRIDSNVSMLLAGTRLPPHP